jgi:folate-dependent phosphoribosylglycinamide formyltransferase PurN
MGLGARLRRVRSAGWWKPAAAKYLIQAALPQAAENLPSDDLSLRAAAAWLARAQDATTDGGIAGRYRLAGGWSSSYPETTGYAIPTLLTLGDVLSDDQFRERANRSVAFLLSVQLPSGAFPALEVADNRTQPSPFNSAQIAHGLHRWFQATGDRRVLDPMMTAARWIRDTQDADGAWRRHSYLGLACTYSAHAACWLGEIATEFDESSLRACAARNLAWVLQQRDAQTGWFDLCGFSSEDHQARRAHTHTIAYTLAGVLRMSECLQVCEGYEAVHLAAERLLERLERSRTLAGVLDHQWQARASYVCLTGNAQLAVLWLRLAEMTGDLRFANVALKAIDEVKRAQPMASRSDGIRGGVPGSTPAGGDYIPFAFPNWAAKFLIDALCAKRAFINRGMNVAAAPAADDVKSAPPQIAAAGAAACPRNVVVYTTRISPKFAQLATMWHARRFQPALVVIETGSASVPRQLAARVRRRPDDTVRICRRRRWRYVRVQTVNAPAAIAAVARAEPSLAVHAGAGILRQAVLAQPRLGTLGAHMGILPRYRGMNVAEWSALYKDAVGCSVFWMDEGIDTGPIIATHRVDVAGCRSIAELRARVDTMQLTELDATLRSIVEDGIVPSSREQRGEEGRQFFRMHRDLRSTLEERLRRDSKEAP